MWRGIHIIGQSSGEDVLSSALHAAELAVSRRTAWSSLIPSELSGCRESLIVANAVPMPDRASSFFSWLREHGLRVPTVAILPADSSALLRLAAEAVDDFLLWPIHQDELRHRVLRLLGPSSAGNDETPPTLARQMDLPLMGEDRCFLDALLQLSQFGNSNAPVLLTGETGTGKELCARALHLSSRRRGGPFIPVECGCIPEQVFESEMFGHTRGAFTDACSEHKGLVALARGGTLF